ncbi:NH(3)-dependent NAD(+) synthetase, putative [Entamoeba dispar SAW760]|uniref:NH(3)-dependent NAD(+) synthetase, putative n=1 Tax=Entamoeba dispar (strain ATCC PRA-260 / SAW760) TaxID=370354 RepID=B0E7U9_ENTDS|nr:NH(3)-dependent NAD(+) synthetase, putative [Entamoeba dispar SAW760]EDR29421.1 NH(3)-dependent NAD(+) synthetase, putative [Entamoeba dispar SAW760]|eukprot:EDR29421.1 NH(3)-dependent NAD(+) synthetase, putative [Entamoeba dispar SAW760]
MDVTKFPLPQGLKVQLDKIRAKRAFNPAEWIEKKCTMLNNYFKECGLKGIVLNCSGGIDSSVTAALCVHAQKMPNSPIQKILCLAQPIHSTASIQNKAFIVCEHLGIEIKTIDQTTIFDNLHSLVESSVGLKGNAFSDGQLRSYMRTPTAYYVSQLMSANGIPSVVMGTGNFDEDGYILYYCKAGDGVVDLSLISDLHKAEVYRVGAELKLPDIILGAVPSADLWSGQTDEDEIGCSYQFIELYTEYLMMNETDKKSFISALDETSLKQFNEWSEIVQKIHKRNSHKKFLPKTLPVYKNMEEFLNH